MADRPDARLVEHRGGVDVELAIPWPTDEAPEACAWLTPRAARALGLRLFRVAAEVEARRRRLHIGE